MEDKIEEYLLGRMSDNDKKAFENEISKDSDLKQEVHFQKQLMTTIQDVRKEQLKASLAAVSVSYTSTRKLVSYFAAAGLLLGGLAFYTFSDSPAEQKVIPSDSIVETIENVETNSIEDKTAVIENTDVTNEVIVAENKSESIVEFNSKNETLIAKKAIKKSIDYSKMDLEPSISGKENGEIKTTSNLDHNPKSLTAGISAEKVKEIIPKIERSSKSFKKYRYDGENLTLIGDYKSNTPYTIYELKVNNSNSLFLKFEDRYYEIKNMGSQISNLELLENKEIISDLNKK